MEANITIAVSIISNRLRRLHLTRLRRLSVPTGPKLGRLPPLILRAAIGTSNIPVPVVALERREAIPTPTGLALQVLRLPLSHRP